MILIRNDWEKIKLIALGILLSSLVSLVFGVFIEHDNGGLNTHTLAGEIVALIGLVIILMSSIKTRIRNIKILVCDLCGKNCTTEHYRVMTGKEWSDTKNIGIKCCLCGAGEMSFVENSK